MTRKRVMVSGCFDILHPGHVLFLQKAASYGDLYVAVGSDAIITQIKGKPPVMKEAERLFLVRSLSCVCNAFWGSGKLPVEFGPELATIGPDYLVVTQSQNTIEKQNLCKSMGIEYRILGDNSLYPLHSTHLKQKLGIPSRLDLCGGWLDQPFVSKLYPGPVVVLSLEPGSYMLRSGMATSTRHTAEYVWGNCLPQKSPEDAAKILFSVENPCWKSEISGSQDALGICLPGCNALYYDRHYWPESIKSIGDDRTLSWLEKCLWMYPLWPRPIEFDVFKNEKLSESAAHDLSDAAKACISAIESRNIRDLGRAITAGFDAQVKMFPAMVDDKIMAEINKVQAECYGLKITGAGGGGYLVLVTNDPPEGVLPIKVRRKAEI